MKLWNILKPDLWIENITELPLTGFREKGFKTLLIDLDNTLTAWNSLEISLEVRRWVAKALSDNFKLMIISNNTSERILPVATALNIPFISKAGKPSAAAFLQGAEITGEKMESTIVVGDQLFTDVLGGKRAGAYTVLVNPLHAREFFGTKISRFFEKIVIAGWGVKQVGNKRI